MNAYEKLREALSQCELFLGHVSRHGHSTLNPGDKCTACRGVDELRGMVVRATLAPPRNCDVGTAEEQVARWMRFCTPKSCAKCPVYQKSDGVNCHFVWLQMPYEGDDK